MALRELLERPMRLPRLRPYVPRPEDPRIFWFDAERDDVVRQTVRRVVDRHGREHRRLELILNDAAFYETERLSSQRDEEARRELPRYRALARRIGRMSDEEKREVLQDLTFRIADDVAGNFDPRVYAIARHTVPKLLTAVMSPRSVPADLLDPAHTRVDELLAVQGDVERLRALAQRGTLVYVPTHSSNLDSVVLGYALLRENLPPVVYGAGKNLFTNPVISFFMHNLGAYRVDRRVRATLYKDVLKTYSTLMVERGYHSLFFPGGGRSRSGHVEPRLKLGLAGTAIEAFARNRANGRDGRVFFVPTTINYVLVLEAESLIEDYLRNRGGARYFIEDDESNRFTRWAAFFRKLGGTSAACVIRFGEPMDPFGNPVDESGHSVGPSGRTVDPGSYVTSGGHATVDPARDAAYTRELGQLLVDRYRRDTVVMSTQLVAHVLWRHLVASTPGLDLFERMRLGGEVGLPREALDRQVGHARDRLLGLVRAGQVRVSPVVEREAPGVIVDRALRTWHGYHDGDAASERGDDIVVTEPSLVFYYGNRLTGFAASLCDEESAEAAREIVAGEAHA